MDKSEENDEDNSIVKSPKSKLLLLEPLNKSQLPTVFCNYPKICEMERPNERAFNCVNPKIRAKFKISNAVRYAAVIGAFKAAGFVETEGNN